MSRCIRALGLCMAIAGCANGVTPSQRVAPPSAMAPVPLLNVRSPLPETPPSAPTAAASNRPIGLVAYQMDDGIWVVNADGTDAHKLLPNAPEIQYPLAWSGDGSRLLYGHGTEVTLALTDAAGSEPEELELQCPVVADSDALLYSCQPDMGSIAISPDGTRLAYAISEGSHDQAKTDVTSSIVVLDLTTGLVTKLESTQTRHPARDCDEAVYLDENIAGYEGENKAPSWSPDGSRLVFERHFIGAAPNSECQEAAFTVNVDGSDLQMVVPPSQPDSTLQPSWTPDGSLAFRAQGAWTRDGRIVSIRWAKEDKDRGDLWIADADGGNARMLEATVPALTAAGCMDCPYPLYDEEGRAVIDPLVVWQTPPFQRFWIGRLLWQPLPAGQP